METDLLLPSNCFLIFFKAEITLANLVGLFTFQFFCGSNIILAPLAPPLLSEPLKVEAEAHAVETNSETEMPVFNIFDFKMSMSFDFNLYFGLSIGSCQINSSLGTSLPK